MTGLWWNSHFGHNERFGVHLPLNEAAPLEVLKSRDIVLSRVWSTDSAVRQSQLHHRAHSFKKYY